MRGADPRGPGGSHTRACPPPRARSSLSGPQRGPRPCVGVQGRPPHPLGHLPSWGLTWPGAHRGRGGQRVLSTWASHRLPLAPSPVLGRAAGPRKQGRLAQVGRLQPLHPPSLRVGPGTALPQLCASAALYPPCPEPAWLPGLQPDPNPLGWTELRGSLFQRQCQDNSPGPGEGLPLAPPCFCNSSWGHRAPDLLTGHLGQNTWAVPPQPRQGPWETGRMNKAPEPPTPPWPVGAPAGGGGRGDSAR